MSNEMSDEDLVKGLCEIESGLTDWEVKFVDSVASRILDRRIELTDKQRNIAERIYREKA